MPLYSHKNQGYCKKAQALLRKSGFILIRPAFNASTLSAADSERRNIPTCISPRLVTASGGKKGVPLAGMNRLARPISMW